jgi:hypothetical protein
MGNITINGFIIVKVCASPAPSKIANRRCLQAFRAFYERENAIPPSPPPKP